MASNGETDPQRQLETLERENAALRTRLDKLEAERASVRRVGWFGLKVFIGSDLRRAFRAWLGAKSLRDPLPSHETADLGAALVRRVVRVSVIGLVVAALPTGLLVWQNYEIRNQTELLRQQIHSQNRQLQVFTGQVRQDRADTLIVRRSQLLATIYDCDDRLILEGFQPESSLSPHCLPSAHPRARLEAVEALTEIEKQSGSFVDLSRADLSGLHFARVDLSEGLLTAARISDSTFESTNFTESFFAYVDAERATFRSTDFCGSSFHYANFRDADFSGSSLQGTDLTGVVGINAIFETTDLSHARLAGADLSHADFSYANLEGAAFSGFAVDPMKAKDFESVSIDVRQIIQSVNLVGADLSKAVNLKQEQVDVALGNVETLLPPGLRRPLHWQEGSEATSPAFLSMPSATEEPDCQDEIPKPWVSQPYWLDPGEAESSR